MLVHTGLRGLSKNLLEGSEVVVATTTKTHKLRIVRKLTVIKHERKNKFFTELIHQEVTSQAMERHHPRHLSHHRHSKTTITPSKSTLDSKLDIPKEKNQKMAHVFDMKLLQ